MTYQATFETGWRATVRAGDAAEASERLARTGRGERFTVRVVTDEAHRVWGKDEDDEYEDGE